MRHHPFRLPIGGATTRSTMDKYLAKRKYDSDEAPIDILDYRGSMVGSQRRELGLAISQRTTAPTEPIQMKQDKAGGRSGRINTVCSTIRTTPSSSDHLISESAAKTAAAQAEDAWKHRESTSLSAVDLMVADRTKGAKVASSLVGWKNHDGKRIFQTFRGGKLVRAEGREAFVLALGDSNNKQGKNKRLRVDTVGE